MVIMVMVVVVLVLVVVMKVVLLLLEVRFCGSLPTHFIAFPHPPPRIHGEMRFHPPAFHDYLLVWYASGGT